VTSSAILAGAGLESVDTTGAVDATCVIPVTVTSVSDVRDCSAAAAAGVASDGIDPDRTAAVEDDSATSADGDARARGL